jgi:hypothetical protein
MLDTMSKAIHYIVNSVYIRTPAIEREIERRDANFFYD